MPIKLTLILIFIVLQNITSAQMDSTLFFYSNLKTKDEIRYLIHKLKKQNYKLDQFRKTKALDYFNLACAYSIDSDYTSCLESLKKCQLSDSSLYQLCYNDKDFYNFSHTDKWREFLLKNKHQSHALLSDSLFLDLSKIAIQDQAYYTEISFYEKKYGPKSTKVKKYWHLKDSLNKENLKLLTYYMNRNINILSNLIVADFASNCFLVIQHSNIKTMEYYLPIIKKLYENKEVRAEEYALLYDRVSVNKNEGIQYYGTQINSETNQPYPIKDETNVDKRRMDLGMESLFEYLLKFGIQYKHRH